MEINRDAYLNKLITRMNNGTVKIITGVRRCILRDYWNLKKSED